MLRALASLLTIAMGAGSAFAQNPPLTVDEAVRLALERNPGLRTAVSGEAIAGERARQARAALLPRLTIVESWQRSDHPVFVFGSLLAQGRFGTANFAIDALNNPAPVSNHRLGIALEQTVFDGFRAASARRAARIETEIAAHESEAARADLRLAVITAYGRAQATEAAVRAARAALETAREDVRRAESRRDVGIETEANVLAFRVHLAEAEARRIRAEADVEVARAALNGLIGADLDEDRPLMPLEGSPQGLDDARALEQDALRARDELRAAALRVEQAELSAKAARGGFWPAVVAQGGAEANGARVNDRRTTWAAGIEVHWNLFNGGADAARVAEAREIARRADAAREQLAIDIRLAVRAAIANHRAAIAREATSRETVEQARESQRIIRDRYEAGLAPAADVLRAAELLAQAEAERIAAAIDVHITAAALARAAGRSSHTP